VDLSAFYLDILKDRLYTSPPESMARRGAQTVLYRIADALARLMAPIMAFTAEEIWRHLPDVPGKQTSIHLSAMPEADERLSDPVLADQWQAIKLVRGEVTKALEEARAQKRIGHSLEAEVVLGLEESLYAQLLPYKDELRFIFIVSSVKLEKGTMTGAFQSAEQPGITVKAGPAQSEKCERCWVHDATVGSCTDHPLICERCYDALRLMGQLTGQRQ
jgi:isoleucyl-tRNA synthetase